MCLIVVKYPGTTITRKTLRNCHLNNTDGSGLAYADAGKLFVEKGFFGFRKLYKRFREIEHNYPESCILVHFRIMTSGKKSEECCHPFYVNKNLVFAHNGIFIGLSSLIQSDTQIFNETVLKKLPKNFLYSEKIVEAIENYAKKGASKLVFLDNKNNITIFNSDSGIWEDGIWFSNSGYKSTYDYYGSNYNQFGFSDGYTSDTYRRACTICKVHQSLLGMKWVKDFDGWVCESCQDIMNDNTINTIKYKCVVCKQSFDLTEGKNKNGKFYCDSCWYALKACYSIVCPHCGSSIVLDWKDRCSICNQIIDEEDYGFQLQAINYID